MRWEAAAGSITVSATVPPNTRAQVRRPDGSAPFDVGSGRHEWIVRDTRAPRPTGSLSLMSTLADISDDPEAYETIRSTLDSVVPQVAQRFRRQMKWLRRESLGQALRNLSASPECVAAVEAALRELSGRRTDASKTPLRSGLS